MTEQSKSDQPELPQDARETINLDPLMRGVSIQIACIVQTLNESDPTFEARFLKRLTRAYYELRDNCDWKDVSDEFGMLRFTRQLLTGFSWVTGQGKPFLSD